MVLALKTFVASAPDRNHKGYANAFTRNKRSLDSILKSYLPEDQQLERKKYEKNVQLNCILGM